MLFKNLLKNLRPLFKDNGFHPCSQNFVLESPECWVIVNFQKSRWSNCGEKTFYVNVAATAKRLLEFCNQSVEKAPPYFECDWRWRAEQFGQDPAVGSWTIRDEGTARAAFVYLEKLFKVFVLPEIKALTTEYALLKKASSNFEYPTLKVRSVLLAANGQMAELQHTVDALIGKFGGGVVADGVRSHIESLRAKFPDETRHLIVTG